MKNRPPYALESVDNALRMLHVLRDQGRLKVSEVATELQIARSTAHRLLAMLVYRDFAVKDDDHTYLPGPALSAPQLEGRPLQQLRRALRPHMDTLCERVLETVNLMVRVGIQTRFLSSVESLQVLHVSDRQGTILPAWKTSGGKALLAELPDEQLVELFQQESNSRREVINPREFDLLLRQIRSIRKAGYAENIEGTETGVSAVGKSVRTRNGDVVAALSISVPSIRYTRERLKVFVHELTGTVNRVQQELALAD